MPLELVDSQGEVVGIIVGYWHNYREKKYYHLVARLGAACNLADLYPKEDLMDIAANRLGAKNMLGRLNRDDLKDKLRKWWLELGEEAADFETYLALRAYLCLNWAHGALKPMQRVAALYYFLYPGEEIKLKGGRLTTAVNLAEMDAFARKVPFPALIGKIIAYPEVEVDVAGVGETILLGGGFNDMGGRNHTHYTLLPLGFGGVASKIEIPMPIYAQRGDMVALKVDEEKGEIDGEKGAVFTGGIIYRMR